MKLSLIPLLFVAAPVLAEPMAQTVTITSTSATNDYALFLIAAPTECPATRFLVVGMDRQAVSPALAPGGSAVLDLGTGFAPGDHQLTVSPLGCDAGFDGISLLTLNRSSPGHVRGQAHENVKVSGAATN